MARFRKRPVEIEAEQFTEENKNRAFNFITCSVSPGRDADGSPIMQIQTLEGVMTATLGDWIIKGVKGEFYPCKPDIFEATYEPVESTAAERQCRICGESRISDNHICSGTGAVEITGP